MSATTRRRFAQILAVAGLALPLLRGDTGLPRIADAVKRLRAFKLVNADEPDVAFSATTRRW